MTALVVYGLIALSCSFLVYKNITMWYHIVHGMNQRLDNSVVVIFPKCAHGLAGYDVEFSTKVIESIWNKYQYQKSVDFENYTIKYFSDSEYFNNVTATIPYLNIQWLCMNMLAILMFTIVSWFLPLSVDIGLMTTIISITVGILSISYMLFHRYYSKKWFGSDDIFYNEPIKADYMMVLSEERWSTTPP